MFVNNVNKTSNFETGKLSQQVREQKTKQHVFKHSAHNKKTIKNSKTSKHGRQNTFECQICPKYPNSYSSCCQLSQRHCCNQAPPATTVPPAAVVVFTTAAVEDLINYTMKQGASLYQDGTKALGTSFSMKEGQPWFL